MNDQLIIFCVIICDHGSPFLGQLPAPLPLCRPHLAARHLRVDQLILLPRPVHCPRGFDGEEDALKEATVANVPDDGLGNNSIGIRWLEL